MHIDTVHEGKRPFKCDTCQTTFSHRTGLNRHVENIHEKNKPFRCDICKLRFSRRNCLIRHMESIHDRNLPIQCNFCDFKCSFESNLKNHIANVHLGNKPFSCDFCVSKYAAKSALRKHVLRVHKSKKPNENQIDANISKVMEMDFKEDLIENIGNPSLETSLNTEIVNQSLNQNNQNFPENLGEISDVNSTKTHSVHLIPFDDEEIGKGYNDSKENLEKELNLNSNNDTILEQNSKKVIKEKPDILMQVKEEDQG